MFSSSATAETSAAPNFGVSRLSVSLIFLLHGLIFSSWVCRIPAAQAKLGLSPGPLGLVLLATSAGSLVSMPLTGWLVAHYGSRAVVRIVSVFFCFALVPLAWASSAAELGAALFVFGAAAGAQNVSMNTHAVAVEKGLLRPIMSGFHALFSLGAIAGSAFGAAAASQGVSMAAHFVFCACVFLVLTIVASAGLHRGSHADSPPKLSLRFPAAVVSLGVLAFCILIVEGSVADWSAVYLESVVRTDAGRAALGFSAYSAAMVAGRFSGDRLTAAFGRAGIVRAGALLAALGLSIALFARDFVFAVAGFAVAGLGLSVITPNVFGAAGRIRDLPPGVGLAAVTTAGYIGFLSGPPLIGGIAQWIGLRLALGLMILAVLTGSVLAGAAGADL